MSTSYHDLPAGTLLGRYEILAPIAAGGMARVWAARLTGSRGFKKIVAIKTMRADVSDDVRFERMFLDEARIASRIRHENVVSILDLGEERELLYLVMEYVDGESVHTIRRAAASGGGIPLRMALRIVADTAAGLHAAHRLVDDDGTPLGLVHRDVSPQNILLSYTGAVKVTDFGVAKAAGRVSQTTHRTLKGKPAFMSPEQLESGVVDCRADVFALGIVAYQLVCGVHPFRGENDLATITNIVSKRPILTPSTHNPNVDQRLEDVMMRALERDPEKRFQSALDFEHAIDEVMQRMRRPRDDELAALMESVMGEPGRERRKQLEQAMAIADQRAAERASSLPPPPGSVSASLQVPDRISAPSGAGTPLAYTSVAPRRSSLRPLLIVGLGVAALIVVGVIATALLTGRERAPEAANESASQAPAPAANPPRELAPSEATAGETSEHAPGTQRDARTSRRRPKRPPAGAKTAAAPAASTPAQPGDSATPAPASTPRKAPVPVMDPGF